MAVKISLPAGSRIEKAVVDSSPKRVSELPVSAPSFTLQANALFGWNYEGLSVSVCGRPLL